MERLTERELNSVNNVSYCKCFFKDCDGDCQRCELQYEADMKLKHYEDLEEQGLLLRTPCKLGDKFYRVNWNNEVEEYKVSCLTQKADGSFKIRVTRLRHGSVHDIIPKEIGETYFLTKEEAEAKLKELENESV